MMFLLKDYLPLNIKNVENQIHGIHSKTEETKMSQIKGEQHLMDLNKTVNFICEKFDEYERDRAEKEKVIVSCRKMLMICLQQ